MGSSKLSRPTFGPARGVRGCSLSLLAEDFAAGKREGKAVPPCENLLRPFHRASLACTVY